MYEYEIIIVYEVYFIFQLKNIDVFFYFYILILYRLKCLMRYMINLNMDIEKVKDIVMLVLYFF